MSPMRSDYQRSQLSTTTQEEIPMLLVRQSQSCYAFQHLFKRQLSLAYTKHEPSKSEPGQAPLVIMHGLFGSKQNNRSISK